MISMSFLVSLIVNLLLGIGGNPLFSGPVFSR